MRKIQPPVLLLLLLLLGDVQTQAQALCRPDCGGKMEGEKVPDPTNCLQYYYCSDPDGSGLMVPSDDPAVCSDGYYFNADPHVMDCDQIPDDTDYCVGLCNPCRLECVEPGTVLADPLDCHTYIICLDDLTPMYTACPDELPYFDYQAMTCWDSPSYCYDLCDACHAYCTNHGKVPDPYDCQGYYLCDPPLLTHFSCPSSEVFNVETLVCEEALGKNCTSLC